MEFEEILPALKRGKICKRTSWGNKNLTIYNFPDHQAILSYKTEGKNIITKEWEITIEDLLAEDWKILVS